MTLIPAIPRHNFHQRSRTRNCLSPRLQPQSGALVIALHLAWQVRLHIPGGKCTAVECTIFGVVLRVFEEPWKHRSHVSLAQIVADLKRVAVAWRETRAQSNCRSSSSKQNFPSAVAIHSRPVDIIHHSLHSVVGAIGGEERKKEALPTGLNKNVVPCSLGT